MENAEQIVEGAFASFEDGLATLWDAASELIIEYAFSVIGAVLILVIGFTVAGMARRWVYTALKSLRNSDETLNLFLAKAARYGVLVLVFVTVLTQFGVQTTSIIAALGAAGIAIGLALQGTLQNIAAGIMLLFLRPFQVGDYVETTNAKGVVKEIGLFATEFETLDGLYVLAPNSGVWGSPVTNYSRLPKRRFDLVVGIDYKDDIDKAFAAFEALAKEHDKVLSNPEPFIFVSNLGDSAVEVTCRIWIATADWWGTSRELTKLAKQRFDAEGLSIPFPQRDIHIIGNAA
ncbi:mechanosensitive ion channel family protein [Oricola thermophila]|uniref:Small-conductance mechanosensitive channel n=1 Tax=Oricola thermophila TaxID=2742145 RepID=A0A6N1VBT4_9HYPH|nr:mechanosensitive ion channel family protein [Oricola thermophila]QKV18466.1 mechanosensitive ion channel family protein [Oricola thermophila]